MSHTTRTLPFFLEMMKDLGLILQGYLGINTPKSPRHFVLCPHVSLELGMAEVEKF
jgi:hypothetical protein